MTALDSHSRSVAQSRITMRQYTSLLITYLRPQWKRVAIMILFLFTSIGLQLLNPQILRVFIDAAQRNTDIWVLTRIGCIFLAVAIGGRIVAAFANYWSQNVSLYATNLLRADLTEHCLRLDRSFYMKYSPGELIERVDGDINGLSSFFSQFVVRILGSGLFIVGILVLVTWQYLWIGMVLIVYMLLGLTLFTRLQKVGKSAYKNSRQAKANMSGFWGEALGSREDMAVNGGANYILHRYFTLQRQERKADVRSEVYGPLTKESVNSFLLPALCWCW